jgi:hypothetical protein
MSGPIMGTSHTDIGEVGREGCLSASSEITKFLEFFFCIFNFFFTVEKFRQNACGLGIMV